MIVGTEVITYILRTGERFREGGVKFETELPADLAAFTVNSCQIFKIVFQILFFLN